MRTHFAPRLLLPVSERDHIHGPATRPLRWSSMETINAPTVV